MGSIIASIRTDARQSAGKDTEQGQPHNTEAGARRKGANPLRMDS